MTDTALDLDACAREPIHIPEAIQPHGFVMVLDRSDLTIRRVGGDIEGLAGVEDWQGAPVSDVVGAAVADTLREMMASGLTGHVARWRSLSRLHYDVTTHPVGDLQIVEVEQSSQ